MAKLSVLKIKVPPTTIILQSPQNMNNVKSVKHGINADKIEQKSILSEKFKTLFLPFIEQNDQKCPIDLTDMTKTICY